MEKEIGIVYQDQYLMVVSKPNGMTSTNEGRLDGVNSLENWAKIVAGIELDRGGVVHRLDKDTSGLVLVAKEAEVLLKLKEIFKNRMVDKRYIALASGDLPESGLINVPTGRSKYSFKKFGVRPDGKKSMTEFKIIDKYRIEWKIYSLVELLLMTGRTHQIRVHMAYMGWPLAGDRTYGGREVLGLKRQFLHAYKLGFKHPVTQEVLEFVSDLPNELKEILDKSEKV